MFACSLSLLVLIALAAIVDRGATVTVDDCPSSVPRDNYLRVHQNSCFQFVYDRRRNYNDANTDCKSHGGTLALLKNLDIQLFVFNQVTQYILLHGQSNEPVWIGLNDKVLEGTFLWEDGTHLTYSNWGVGEGPHHLLDNNQDCVVLSPLLGLWFDEECEADLLTSIFDKGRPYVCQYDALGATEEPVSVDSGAFDTVSNANPATTAP